MNPETESTRSPLDTPLLGLAVLIVVATIGAFFLMIYQILPLSIPFLGFVAAAAFLITLGVLNQDWAKEADRRQRTQGYADLGRHGQLERAETLLPQKRSGLTRATTALRC